MFFRKRNETAAAPLSPASPPQPAVATPAAPIPAPQSAPAAPAVSVAPPDAAPDAGREPGLDEAKRRAQQHSKQMAASLGSLVVLLMRSQSERQLTLADLEWMVLPAISYGQIALAEAQAKDTGLVTPVGALLWAFVSPEVDARLSDVSKAAKLTPEEWRSGDIPWVILAAGDQRILGGLLDRLKEPAFKGKLPKMRLRGSDGKIVVGNIDVRHEAPAA